MEIPLIIEEPSGIPRVKEPVTVGIPFPRGALFDATLLALRDGGGALAPLQAQVTDRWPDQSCRWLLLDFQVTAPAFQTVHYSLERRERTLSGNSHCRIVMRQSVDAIHVDTGAATFQLDKNRFPPFEQVVVNKIDVLEQRSGRLTLTDDQERVWEPKVEKSYIETRGALRSTLYFEGSFSHVKKRHSLATFFSRLHFYAGHSLVKVDFTVRNPRAAKHRGGLWDLGDPGSIYFEDLSLALKLRGKNETAIYWLDGPAAQLEKAPSSTLEICQDSSGGKNWQSHNHVNRFGKVMNSFRGFRACADAVIRRGNRAEPTVAVSTEGRYLAAAVPCFWQNFPKTLEANRNELIVRFFPTQYADLFELQGGEQKSHTVYLRFGSASGSGNSLAWIYEPLMPRARPEWYAESRVFPYMVPEDQDPDKRYLELVHCAIEGKSSFFARREIIDEYGWRHFGDLYADHEAVFDSGPDRLISHYNNQYDAVYAFALHYARSGDSRWFELMRDLARHVIDIDVYHTLGDKSAYNGGLFWHTDHYADAATSTHRTFSRKTMEERGLKDYGGGPCNEHLYTTGLMTYYFLTSDPQAREAVLGLADWVVRMDDGNLTPFRFLSRSPTGLASQTVSRDYHGPGRGAGNSINALLDAYRLTRDEHYLAKAEELIRRCIHPDDPIDSLNLIDAERRWSYLAFLQVLGKYLDCKVELGSSDFMFHYARESLLYYARWMRDNEVPYSRVMDRVEYPTETWVVHDLRKSNVLEWAARYSSGDERGSFLKKAEFFYRSCFRDLEPYPTKTCPRPLVMLLHYGVMHSYFQLFDADAACSGDNPKEFGPRRIFIPQRRLVEARLKFFGGIGAAAMISFPLLIWLIR